MKAKVTRFALALLFLCATALPAHAARQVIVTSMNILAYSQQFITAPANTFWAADASGAGVVPTITDNFALAPDGTLTAGRLQLNDGASGFSRLTQTSIYTYDCTRPYTGSTWIKTNDNSTKVVALRFFATVTTVTVTGTWQQFTLTMPPGCTQSLSWQILLWDVQSTAVTADLLIWGAQVVKANWAGPYQPTTSAGVNIASAIRNTP